MADAKDPDKAINPLRPQPHHIAPVSAMKIKQFISDQPVLGAVDPIRAIPRRFALPEGLIEHIMRQTRIDEIGCVNCQPRGTIPLVTGVHAERAAIQDAKEPMRHRHTTQGRPARPRIFQLILVFSLRPDPGPDRILLRNHKGDARAHNIFHI